jgi:hypothetical protein
MKAREIYEAGKEGCPCREGGWCSAAKELCGFKNCPFIYWLQLLAVVGKVEKKREKQQDKP